LEVDVENKIKISFTASLGPEEGWPKPAGRSPHKICSLLCWLHFPFQICLNHFSGSCARGEVLLRMSNAILDSLQTVDFDFDGILSSNFAVLSSSILPNCLGKSVFDLRISMNVFLDYYVSKFFLIEQGIVLSAPIWYLGNTDSERNKPCCPK